MSILLKHVCPINHDGSTDSMEAADLIDCFMNCIENTKLRYTHCIEDGDSKAYHEDVKNDPNLGTVLEKLECMCHIQKRVGGSLHNLKSTMKLALADGKTLREKGHLADKVIKKLQNYLK